MIRFFIATILALLGATATAAEYGQFIPGKIGIDTPSGSGYLGITIEPLAGAPVLFPLPAGCTYVTFKSNTVGIEAFKIIHSAVRDAKFFETYVRFVRINSSTVPCEVDWLVVQ